MILKKLYSSIFFLFIGVTLAAQADSTTIKRSIAFGSMNTVGVLEGEKGASLQIQTINGFRYEGWFAGIGLGIDNYRFNGIPLFFDVRKKIFASPVPLHIYADAGVHFTLGNKLENDWVYSRFNNGFIYEAGLGYTLPLIKHYELIISAGYSEKSVQEDRFTKIYCINPPCNDIKESYDYRFKRIAVKAGISF